MDDEEGRCLCSRKEKKRKKKKREERVKSETVKQWFLNEMNVNGTKWQCNRVEHQTCVTDDDDDDEDEDED